MNSQKAQEFFSAYYEGDLEAGLKEAFERALVADPALAEEYRQFKIALDLFAREADEPIELPHDLHDRIMQKLDHHDWEAKRTAKTGFFGNWRLVAFGGLAVVAIAAAFVSVIQPNQGKGNAMGSIGAAPSVKATTTLDAILIEGKLNVRVSAIGSDEVVVRNAATQEEVKSIRAKDKTLDSEIATGSDTAVILDISPKNGQALSVVVPGDQAISASKSEGTVRDCALAMADLFRSPMIMRVSQPDRSVSWEFTGSESVSDRAAILKDQNLTLSLRSDGILVLSD